MAIVKLSSKFQIAIPSEIRESMQLTSGMRLEIVPFTGRIELIPLKPLKSLKGSLKGIDTTIKRAKDRL